MRAIKGLVVFLLLASFCVVSSADAQCTDGHLDVYEGCTLERHETFPWPGSELEASCRQLLESRLFFTYLDFFQSRNAAIRQEMDNVISDTDRFLAVMGGIKTTLSILQLSKGLAVGNGIDVTESSLQLFESNSGAAGDILQQFLGVDSEIASALVQLVIQEGAFIARFAASPASVPLSTLTSAVPDLLVLYGAVRGTLALDALTEQINSNLVGWWYLEEFYRLGGTLEGSGTDAHGLVAQKFGLPSDSDVFAVVDALAAERGFSGASFWGWFSNDSEYHPELAVEFAEHIKAGVAERLAEVEVQRPFSARF